MEDPPLAARYQPLNVEPASIGAAGKVIDEPVAKVEVEIAEPPCVSKVRAFAFALHCAKMVKAAVLIGEYESAALPTRVPDVAASYQPLNVYPARVGAAGRVNEVPVTQLCEATDDPP